MDNNSNLSTFQEQANSQQSQQDRRIDLIKNFHRIALFAHITSLGIIFLTFLSWLLPFIKSPDLISKKSGAINIFAILKEPLMNSYDTYIYILFAILAIGAIIAICGVFDNLSKNTKIKHIYVTIRLGAIVFYIAFAIALLGMMILFGALRDDDVYKAFALVVPIVFAVVIFVHLIVTICLITAVFKRTYLSTSNNFFETPVSVKKNIIVIRTSTNALTFLLEGVIFCALAAIYIVFINQINSQGIGFITAGAGLYICAVLAVIATIVCFVAFGYLISLKKKIAKDSEPNDVFTHKYQVFPVGSILSIVLALVVLVFCVINKPIWSVAMYLKSDDVDLGMTETEVLDVLGNPSAKDYTTWYYYNKKFEKKYTEAMESIEKLDPLEDFEELIEAYQKIDGQKYTVIEVVFDKSDSEATVSQIMYNRNLIYDAHDTENSKVTQIDSVEFFDEDNNKIDVFCVFEKQNNVRLVSDISAYKAVVRYNDHDFIKKTFDYMPASKENGKYLLNVANKYVDAYFEINAEIIHLDDNGVCMIPDGCSVIRTNTFSTHENEIKEIYIPSSITKIEEDAFANFTSLEKVYIEDIAKWCNIEFESATSNPLAYTQKAYLNNSEITDLVIPDGIERISAYTFTGATFLTNVSIPDSVVSIGICAFDNISNIIEHSEGLNYIDNWVISCDANVDNPVFKNNVRGVCDLAFANSEKLTDVTIPASVSRISYGCFKNCQKLIRVEFAGNIETIEKDAFSNCPFLERVIILNSMEEEPVLKEIGDGAFYGCTNLKTILFAPDEETKSNNEYKKLVFPDTLSKIGEKAFYNCTTVEELYASSISHLGSCAFEKCNSIKNITISSIPDYVGETPLPVYADKIVVSAPIANTIEFSLASEITIENGESLQANIQITKLLKSIKITGVKNIDIDLNLGTMTPSEYEHHYSDHPKTLALSAFIGKDAENVKFTTSFLMADSCSINFEDPNGWSFIPDWSYKCKFISPTMLTNSSSFDNDFKEGVFKKGKIDYINDVCLNDQNKSNTFMIIGLLLEFISIIIVFIFVKIVSKKTTRKNGKFAHIISYYILPYVAVACFLLGVYIQITSF